MPRTALPKLAAALRELADRLEPRRRTRRRASLPLVRQGGTWWARDEVVGFVLADDGEPADERR